MLIRVRTNAGLWRVADLAPTSTVPDLLAAIASTRPLVEYTSPLCSDPGCKSPLVPDGEEDKTLGELGLQNGSMVYCGVVPATCVESKPPAAAAAGGAGVGGAGGDEDPPPPAAASSGGGTMKRIIGKDGSIKLVPAENADDGGDDARGFRKGQMALRDMKMQWTLAEFTAMDDQYVFKVKRQEESWVGKGGCSLDTPSANDFQSYLRRFNFQRQRFGLLYGRFEKDKDEEDDKEAGKDKAKDKDEKKMDMSWPDDVKVIEPFKPQNIVVEAIYEPPQEADPDAAEGFVVLDDPNEDQVDALAAQLGLRRVGWIFGHPPREKGFQMSAAEVIMAAEFQLEAAGGVEPTPFVSVKVTVGDDGNVSFEAFQVSRQCMEMVAEGALEVGPNPGFCYVNETFTAIQEGKQSKTVENNFFLAVVPIVQHTSEMFLSDFPKANRDMDDRVPSKDEMKRQLGKSGSQGWTFVDVLADFNLLIYLLQFLDAANDMPKICQSIANRDIPLDDGYKIILTSMAGLDAAY